MLELQFIKPDESGDGTVKTKWTEEVKAGGLFSCTAVCQGGQPVIGLSWCTRSRTVASKTNLQWTTIRVWNSCWRTQRKSAAILCPLIFETSYFLWRQNGGQIRLSDWQSKIIFQTKFLLKVNISFHFVVDYNFVYTVNIRECNLLKTFLRSFC